MVKITNPKSVRLYNDRNKGPVWQVWSELESKWDYNAHFSLHKDASIKDVKEHFATQWWQCKPSEVTVIETKYVKGKNYRIRELQSGELQIEFRSTKYTGIPVKRLPKNVSMTDAHKHAMETLRGAANADVPELARRVLAKYSLGDLINAYLNTYKPSGEKDALGLPRYKLNISERDKEYMDTFLKKEAKLCEKTLDKLKSDDFQAYINKRMSDGVTGYSITRSLSAMRKMFSSPGRHRLYGLIDHTVELKNYLSSDYIEYPKNENEREWALKPGEEYKIFDAIEDQCGGIQLNELKWKTLVRLALSTCLRRGVLLHIKWKDVDWTHKVIRIDKTYWEGKKKAPPMVPLSKRLAYVLKKYYDAIPSHDKLPEVELFENADRRDARHKGKRHDHIYSTDWVNATWHRIIRRTELWQPKTDSKGHYIYDEKGDHIKDWFHFHDLRHTATSWYAEPPYSLDQQEYEYLKGNRIKYNHPDHIKINNRIRDKIDAGNNIISEKARKALKPGPVKLTNKEVFVIDSPKKPVMFSIKKLQKREEDHG